MADRGKKKQRIYSLHTTTSGRVRVKMEDIYRTEHLAYWIESKLRNESGILTASANPYTANILIRFDPLQMDLSGILKRLRQWLRESREPELASQIRRSHQPTSRRHKRLTPEHPWHLLGPKEVLKIQGTHAKTGLSQAEAQKRLQKLGLNRVPPPPMRTSWEILSGQLTNLPTILLIGSAGLSIVTGGGVDAILIVTVVVANAVIGYVTESSAEEVVGVLSQTKIQKANVIRDGKCQEIPVEFIVVGDILSLSPGSYVPADCRVIVEHSLSADESLITGESFPTTKSVHALQGDGIPIGDRANMVYCGTLITGGDGQAIVVATGQNTEIGHIQSLIGLSGRPATALQVQLSELTQKLVIASMSLSGALLALQLFRGRGLIESLKSSITLAVAAIPEGLPTVATTILAQGVSRLQSSGVLIRRIGSVENLGRVNLICLDKTGTLTRNRMTVTSIRTVHEKYEIDENSSFLKPELKSLMRTAALCNDADETQGSPTEMALIRMAISSGIKLRKLRMSAPRLETRHRGEKRQLMSTTHRISNENYLLAVKGSPNDVLKLCRFYLQDDTPILLSPSVITQIQSQNHQMATHGLRVLGFAFKEAQHNGKIHEDELTWLGLVGMSDPLRPEVHRFLKDLKLAGVRPVMVTGDQASTALAIGKSLGLGNGAPLKAIESHQLESASPDEVAKMASHADVFARVSPAHKLEIVQALQRSGDIVAMTGDGINDGPALKTANVGIAMGTEGTDVARKVADVILVKDDLYSIILAIQEGRKIRENLKKSVDYIIAQNLTEILLTFISTLTGLGEPLNPMQLLWVNLITDILPELALAQEKPEENLIKKGPEHMWERLLSKQDLTRIGIDTTLLTTASLASYIYGVRRYGLGPQAKTLAFLSINTASLLYTLTARSRRVTIFDRKGLASNKYVPLALGAGFSTEFLSATIPFLRGLLGGSKVNPIDFLLTTGISASPLFLIEITKFISTRLAAAR